MPEDRMIRFSDIAYVGEWVDETEREDSYVYINRKRQILFLG